MITKRNCRSMNNEVQQDKKPAVDHGSRSLRHFNRTFLYLVLMISRLSILPEEQNPGNNVYCKSQKQTFTENIDNHGMTVELISICLKKP